MQDIDVLATFDSDSNEIVDAAIYVKDNVIEWVGKTKDIPEKFQHADESLSLKDRVVIPGMVSVVAVKLQTTTILEPWHKDANLFGCITTLILLGRMQPLTVVYPCAGQHPPPHDPMYHEVYCTGAAAQQIGVALPCVSMEPGEVLLCKKCPISRMMTCLDLQDSKLFGWLSTLYCAWEHLTVSISDAPVW